MCAVVKNHKKLQHVIQHTWTRFEFFTHRRHLINFTKTQSKNHKKIQQTTKIQQRINPELRNSNLFSMYFKCTLSNKWFLTVVHAIPVSIFVKPYEL